ncbi:MULTISPECIES: pyridoxal kinase PdxY [Dermabacter]|uniref:pyridoxal kinase n=1 Tax=Dermabacter vaginalis TaxID=1630135 RepID=A0A1B0ZHW0_9MICO|nr:MULTISPECIES: pyridoxal kinase PdxY [Dermabacter]SHV77625.1 Pyridoxamine kinase [Mycobacteroides abscessus subsp. abscessus]ANP27521.1 pyridoxal kinase [Dermabacter vaginalis]EPH14236.1 pyridoxal kinase [Dermabacter sp. HFH0086]MCG7442518.1 pyridoxal kinase PdxY [Dermabacter vaginalis]MCT1806871.1 pyridoxal kinase PdxY [Dermabacter hominis]
MKILSIQSAVAYGHAGNSAAVFPLQRLGHEVWPVNTVLFSNHTGHPTFRGPVIDAKDVHEVVLGIEELGILGEADAVLSGYQGSAAVTDVILDAVERVKKHNPRAVYIADPVMGNAGEGFYVDSDIPPLMANKVVPAAEVLTPNHFELGVLTDTDVSTLEGTLTAVEQLRAEGPDTVLVTSVLTDKTTPGTLELLVADSSGAHLISTPRLKRKVHGSGDVTTALFTAHLLGGAGPVEALEKTAASVFELIDRTLKVNARELLIVESQDAFVNPDTKFKAHPLPH